MHCPSIFNQFGRPNFTFGEGLVMDRQTNKQMAPFILGYLANIFI